MAEADLQRDRMVAQFEAALEGRPNYALGMVGLAETVALQGDPVRAFELCRKALAAEPLDPEAVVKARRLLATFAPRYHVPMMNDARRNGAWANALGKAAANSRVALEIGTGAGMLSLFAARAGAKRIVTCERDPLVAHLARRVIADNGFADRVSVVAKPSHALKLGEDLPEPADLVFCDIFGDHLLDFDPLPALVDARRRLSRPDAVVVPAFGGIRVALARWDGYEVAGQLGEAAGFDLTALAAFAPASVSVRVGEPDLTVVSEPAEALRFDFSADSNPREGRVRLQVPVLETGEVNAVVHWIRLELDSETMLEARPEPGAHFFSSPRVWPLPAPIHLKRGEALTVIAAYETKRLNIWAEPAR